MVKKSIILGVFIFALILFAVPVLAPAPDDCSVDLASGATISTLVTCMDENDIIINGNINVTAPTIVDARQFGTSSVGFYGMGMNNNGTIAAATPDVNDSTPSQYTQDWMRTTADGDGDFEFQIVADDANHRISIYFNRTSDNMDDFLWGINLDGSDDSGTSMGPLVEGIDILFGYYSGMVEGQPVIVVYNSTEDNPQAIGASGTTYESDLDVNLERFYTVYYDNINNATEIVIDITGTWLNKSVVAWDGADGLYYTTFTNDMVITPDGGSLIFYNSTVNITGNITVGGTFGSLGSSIISFDQNNSYLNVTSDASIMFVDSIFTSNNADNQYNMTFFTSDYILQNLVFRYIGGNGLILGDAGGNITNITLSDYNTVANWNGIYMMDGSGGSFSGINTSDRRLTFGGISDTVVANSFFGAGELLGGEEDTGNLFSNNIFTGVLDINTYGTNNNTFHNMIIDNTYPGVALVDNDNSIYNWWIYNNSHGEISWYSNNLNIPISGMARELWLTGTHPTQSVPSGKGGIINISWNYIYINASTVTWLSDPEIPFLREAATLNFTSLSNSSPIMVYRNGVRCDNSNTCNITGFSEGVLTVDVDALDGGISDVVYNTSGDLLTLEAFSDNFTDGLNESIFDLTEGDIRLVDTNGYLNIYGYLFAAEGGDTLEITSVRPFSGEDFTLTFELNFTNNSGTLGTDDLAFFGVIIYEESSSSVDCFLAYNENGEAFLVSEWYNDGDDTNNITSIDNLTALAGENFSITYDASEYEFTCAYGDAEVSAVIDFNISTSHYLMIAAVVQDVVDDELAASGNYEVFIDNMFFDTTEIEEAEPTIFYASYSPFTLDGVDYDDIVHIINNEEQETVITGDNALVNITGGNFSMFLSIDGDGNNETVYIANDLFGINDTWTLVDVQGLMSEATFFKYNIFTYVDDSTDYTVDVSFINDSIDVTDGGTNPPSLTVEEVEEGVEDSSPSVTLNFPPDGIYNDSASTVNVTVNCGATDDIQLANISLYITNSSNQSFSLNQTTIVTGTSNTTTWIVPLGVGNYTWNCLAYDNNSQSAWGTLNRSGYLNYTAGPSVMYFTGYTYATDGSVVNGTNVTIEMRSDFGQDPSNVTSTLSNQSGFFNMTLGVNESLYYRIIINRYTDYPIADYVGQSLPDFPYSDMSDFMDIETTFYLKEAKTLNVTAYNITGDSQNFRYMVKDQAMGYPVVSEWDTATDNLIVSLPVNRNYSVAIFPEQTGEGNPTPPLSYNINNLSDYEEDTVNIEFNTSFSFRRVSGYVNASEVSEFDSLVMIVYLYEMGEMIFDGDPIPYNVSAMEEGETDIYDPTTGLFNITLGGSAGGDGLSMMMMAVANDSEGNYYLGFQNLSLGYSESEVEGTNFSIYPALGSVMRDVTLEDVDGGQNYINISVPKFPFWVQSNGSNLTSLNAHVEVDVDYTDYGGPEFTWMMDKNPSNGNAHVIYLPLINISGVEKFNIYSQMYAPISKEYSINNLQSEPVIVNLSQFNPGGIEDSIDSGLLQIKMYISNSTCSVPYPPSSCSSGGSDTMDNFKPMSLVVGGGALDIEMSLTTNGIAVRYVNVDMMASGPPDAEFDLSATSATSGDAFENAWRFGSMGPDIYDKILLGMPYADSGAGGLNEDGDINVSIPTLYNDDWESIWNTSDGVGNLPSYYTDYNEGIYAGLVNGTGVICGTTYNSSNACSINTTANMIWIEIPHFSGVRPTVTGTATAAAAASPGGSSPSGKSGSTPTVVNDSEVIGDTGLDVDIGEGLHGEEEAPKEPREPMSTETLTIVILACVLGLMIIAFIIKYSRKPKTFKKWF